MEDLYREIKMVDTDIVLFLKYAFHSSGMNPISNELTKLGIDHVVASKRHIIYDKFNETGKRWKYFIIADEWADLFRNCSENLITISHSMANKNTTFNNRNNEMDYMFIPSHYYKNELLMRGVRPRKKMVVTGYVPADKIFNKKMNTDSWWHQNKERHFGNTVNILIAPTYNRDLSLVDELIRVEHRWEMIRRIVECEHTNYRIAFKPHPVLPKKYPDQMSALREFEMTYGPDKFYIHEDSHSDIADAILWSDVVIGDCSGAILLAVAGHKPTLLFSNAFRERSEYYDPTGPEWTFRKRIGRNLTTFDNLLEDINYTLYKDYVFSERIQLANLIYGEHQGNAAANCAKYIQKLYEGG